ncbi:MAG: SCO family protein [Acidobacteriaceae bacterium]|nr:SCO family protein [Acidobacteriaceae bacterium]
MRARHPVSYIVILLFALAMLSVGAEYRGGLVSPPLPKPSFTLTDTSGAPFDFRTRTDGYVTLLFFGYTHCPDMCPLQMFTIAKALKTLSPETASKFKVVFVTTDPERDSPEVLRAWLDHFGKTFIGLTGSKGEIESAQMAANVNPAQKSGRLSDRSYAMGHAVWVLAYTKDNLAHVIYPVGVKREDWAHDLPLLAQETWNEQPGRVTARQGP